MEGPALVLNRGWTAIGTTTVRQSLVLLVRGSARAIDPATYEVFDLEEWLLRSELRCGELPRERLVRAPNQLVEKPEVIVLTRYNKIPGSRSPSAGATSTAATSTAANTAASAAPATRCRSTTSSRAAAAA